MRLDLPAYWYQKRLHPFLFCLLPFSVLFRLLVRLRKQAYRRGWLKTVRFPVPVIVVGNITVGGTGKTPLTIHLAKLLLAHGYHPGIVSRGVGGKQHHKPHVVALNDSPAEVGDEALLLHRETQCPVVISRHRVQAVQYLLQQMQCDVVLSDDGLQHYALARQIEIAVVDGSRQFGNCHLLPAGPLREPITRLHDVDFVVVNGSWQGSANQKTRLDTSTPTYFFTIKPDQLVSLQDPTQQYPIQQWSCETFRSKTVHAVAAIGNPTKFFDSLTHAGFTIIPHVFPDHYLYQAADFKFNDTLPILMTAKDAVKCERFCDARYWSVTVATEITHDFAQALLQRLLCLSDRPHIPQSIDQFVDSRT